MSKSPNWLDKTLARWLSGQVPVVILLLGLAIAGLFGAVKMTSDAYLQSCAVEISVSSLFFLALYLFHIEKFTPGVAATLLVGGAGCGVLGWIFSQANRHPLASAFLLELASAAIMFIVIELVLRGMLLAAEQRNAKLAKEVQHAREQALRKIEDAAITGAMIVLAAVDATRKREEVEKEVRAHWEPNVPEPLFTFDEEALSWSMAGSFGWRPPED